MGRAAMGRTPRKGAHKQERRKLSGLYKCRVCSGDAAVVAGLGRGVYAVFCRSCGHRDKQRRVYTKNENPHGLRSLSTMRFLGVSDVTYAEWGDATRFDAQKSQCRAAPDAPTRQWHPSCPSCQTPITKTGQGKVNVFWNTGGQFKDMPAGCYSYVCLRCSRVEQEGFPPREFPNAAEAAQVLGITEEEVIRALRQQRTRQG